MAKNGAPDFRERFEQKVYRLLRLFEENEGNLLEIPSIQLAPCPCELLNLISETTGGRNFVYVLSL